jgi:glycosyltransferase involved in cell wall biosynthesis
MFDAIRAAPGWLLDLVGPVAPADEDRLRSVLQDDRGLAARVRLHGRLEPRASWALAQGAWAGLLLLDATQAFDPAVPTKLYEYLACGLPVLATPLTRQAALVRESGSGCVVADASEASEVLRRWADHPEEVTTLGERGRSWWETGGAGTAAYAELAARVGALAGRRVQASTPAD